LEIAGPTTTPALKFASAISWPGVACKLLATASGVPKKEVRQISTQSSPLPTWG
jgi:hypothetical protein